MKVCIITTAFPRHIQDDRGIFILEAARAIQANGCDVRVVAMHSPGVLTQENMDGIEVIRPRYMWPQSLEILQGVGGGLPEIWRKNKLSRLIIWPFLATHTWASAIYGRGCDIIHANWTLSSATAWASRLYHRKPWVVTVQGSDIFQATKIPAVKEISRITLTGAHRVFALSRSLRSATAEIGVPENKIKIMPNGVDCEKFTPALPHEKENFFLFVGSLIERKGVSYLLQAWKEAQIKNYQLVIIGEGPQEASLKNAAQTLGISQSVVWVGAQKPIEIRCWMRRAYALILPSVEEGQGVVLLEALASGTPCIGSDVGGIPDVITPEVGMLVQPRDTAGLANAMQLLAQDKKQWQAMSVQARQRAETVFNWNTISQAIVAEYKSALRSIV